MRQVDLLFGVKGMSFCGSTIFGMIANTHPNIFHVGEICNLASPRVEGVLKEKRVKNAKGLFLCRPCRHTAYKCPIFSGMTLPVKGSPYPMVLDKVNDPNKTIICDTSKVSNWFNSAVELEWAKQYYFVVLIKDPISAFLSFHRRNLFIWDMKGYKNLFSGFCRLWVDFYQTVLRVESYTKKPHRYLFYDDFFAAPYRTFKKISDEIGIPATFKFADLEGVSENHYVLGNEQTINKTFGLFRSQNDYYDTAFDSKIYPDSLYSEVSRLWMQFLTSPKRLK